MFKWLIFQWQSLINSVHFWHMKRKADHLHKVTGKQYFVIPGNDKTLQVVNNDMMKEINKRLPKEKRVNHYQILKSAYYKTPTGKLTR